MFDDYDMDFSIMKLQHPVYDYLVIGNTSSNAVNFVTAADFAGVTNGRVAFDLLLHNGVNANRFAVMEIHNGKLDKTTLKYYAHLDSAIDSKCTEYYAMHTNLISQFCLSEREKKIMFHAIKDYFCATYA
jgi:hypothetical protein